MTTQPHLPLSCKGSERVSSGDSAEDWQRGEDGRMKKSLGFEKKSQNLPSKSKNSVAKELQKGWKDKPRVKEGGITES